MTCTAMVRLLIKNHLLRLPRALEATLIADQFPTNLRCMYRANRLINLHNGSLLGRLDNQTKVKHTFRRQHPSQSTKTLLKI